MPPDDPPPAARARHATDPPSLDIRVDSSTGRLPLGVARVRAIAGLVLRAERCRRAHIAVHFVTPRAIARLNRVYVGHAGATDIVTLQHARTVPGAPVVGDIFIAPAVACANARVARCGVREELARLTIHGVLHALGHAHPDGEDRTTSSMWRRQEQLLVRALRAGLA